MDAALDEEMRALVSKQAITELIYRMARAVDRCDADLMRGLFHADATDDHGMFRGTAADFVPWVMGVLANMRLTQHMIGNILIELDGDQARAETYFIAHHLIAAEKSGIFLAAEAGAPDQFMVAGGRYLDRFERRDGAWRFSHRHAVFDWNAEAPATDKWDRPALAGWVFGERGPGDASYANFAGGSAGDRQD
ncbi:nuclear transport factor 2 family protein [Sphingomonas profundi]|uniref:nuclear transport factor 2 family protein n=1 Tax=Alterirhizorhabdus profundi TaxID=2681549 RepID=UPI0012E83294|nr:nuclear transport factor 2 family protein [Sphingomonas profundi]